MTKEQIVNVLTDYSERYALDCEFEEEEEGVTLCESIIMQQGVMQGEQLERLMVVWDGKKLMSAVEFLYEFEDDRVEEIKAFLEYMEEVDSVLSYKYMSEPQMIVVYVNYNYEEEDIEDVDEDLLELLFFAPLIGMERIFGSLMELNDGCLADEAIEKMVAEEDEEYEKATDNKERFHDVRYYFEHRFLPRLFYNDMEGMTNDLSENKGEILYSVMCDICEENCFLMPYNAEEYRVYFHKASEDCKIIRIVMPEPAETPLCYEVYLIFNNQCTDGMYFTVERGPDRKTRYLCAWDVEGGHNFFGSCTRDSGAIKKRIAQIFGVEK